jgi:hypothetical protein
MTAFEFFNSETGNPQHQFNFKAKNQAPIERIVSSLQGSVLCNFVVPALEPLLLVLVNSIHHRRACVGISVIWILSREKWLGNWITFNF